jgi:hypothetical protein
MINNGAYTTNCGGKRCIQTFDRKSLMGRGHLGDKGVDERIILK